MKIGLIGAMHDEIAALKNEMMITGTKTVARMEFTEGSIGNTEVVAVQSGIGKVNAAICAQILIDHFGVTHIINSGIAGSLNNVLNIGDFVVSTDVVHHDFDTTVFGYQPGEVSQLGTASFPADEDLRKKLAAAIRQAAPDINMLEGRVASGDQFISDAARKQWIRDTFHADCCEMEGSAIAQTAWINNVPFVIVRAISDKADGSDLMDYIAFESAAARHSADMLIAVLKQF
ncbi:MAG: 5'-methylthioadenosine/adenosylhomocysteine nucleosidase [Solobacterium sp.]|nr:5'-methylthioadenosine/adenosylhomocysteine nucleosidase [Solobacterium sp.]